eukprot:scaffold35467_cov101-Isochrysis_galbana.AAC.1
MPEDREPNAPDMPHADTRTPLLTALPEACPPTRHSPTDPSRQSGMVQPVVQEMFATVHAAGSSLLGLFSSCTTFDSTKEQDVCKEQGANSKQT